MRVSAKADYAVRAAAELAAAQAEEAPVKGERLAEAQDIPLQFLEHILLELKHHGIVRARRGAKGGYWLAKPAEEITVADILRAVLEHVTLADLVSGDMPSLISELAAEPDAWAPR